MMHSVHNWVTSIASTPRQRQAWTLTCAVISTIGVGYATYQLYQRAKHTRESSASASSSSSSSSSLLSVGHVTSTLDFPAEDNPHASTQRALNLIRAGSLDSVGQLVYFLRGDPHLQFSSGNNNSNGLHTINSISNNSNKTSNAFRARVSLYYIQFLQESYLPATRVNKAHEVERNMYRQLMSVDLTLREAEVQRATGFDNNNLAHVKLLQELWNIAASVPMDESNTNTAKVTEKLQMQGQEQRINSTDEQQRESINTTDSTVTMNKSVDVKVINSSDSTIANNVVMPENGAPSASLAEHTDANGTKTSTNNVITSQTEKSTSSFSSSSSIPVAATITKPFMRIGSHWTDLGFQGDDPATDLRGGGMFALRQLVHFAQTHTTAFRQMIAYNKDVQARNKDHWYLLAVVSIHLSAQILLQRDHALFIPHLEVLYDTIRLPEESVSSEINNNNNNKNTTTNTRSFHVISRRLLAEQMNIKLSDIHNDTTKAFWEHNASDGEAGLMLLHHALLLHFKQCWERDEPHVMAYNTYMAEKVFSTFFSDKWQVPKSLYTLPAKA